MAEQRDGRDSLIVELDELCDKLKDELKTAKTEAYKEFAARVKKLWGNYTGYEFEQKI